MTRSPRIICYVLAVALLAVGGCKRDEPEVEDPSTAVEEPTVAEEPSTAAEEPMGYTELQLGDENSFSWAAVNTLEQCAECASTCGDACADAVVTGCEVGNYNSEGPEGETAQRCVECMDECLPDEGAIPPP